VFLGTRGSGNLSAFDLASGDEKWKWTGEGPPYGSPVLMTVADTKQLVTLTDKSLVGLSVADGKLLWQATYGAQYMSGTPIVDGQTVICSGPAARMGGGKGGTTAFQIEKQGHGFAAKELWTQAKSPAGIYNTPVLKDGLLFGLSPSGGGGGMGRQPPSNIFCMDAKTGDVLWTDTAKRGECGAILDTGKVLLALTSDAELVAFEPRNKEYVELARYKVGDKTGNDGPWAYPIIAGNRVFVKSNETVTLWTIE
jgi:outer membrane protein assembly factor BamB